MARIGINGFGRIGRYLVRLMAERNEFPVVINARADNASLAHLFKYDSVHHTFKGTVGHDENGIIINGTHIAVTRCKPNEWQWKDYGVDLVVESTGTIKKRAGLAEHMACGAKKVIMSAPVSDADITIVMGVNDGLYDPAKHDVVSSASCTTNCLAPVVPGLPMCPVCTEKNRLSQLIINLVTNAIKFTSQGSIRFGYEHRGKELYFYVTDTGCGIPKDKQESIFGRFVKLNSFAQGTGLGLSICRTLVEHMGGHIGVDSEEGKGSTFWFSLPYKAASTSAGTMQKTEIQPISVEKDKLTILIAEDNESNYRLFESILGHDYHLIHAWDGREAVERFKRENPQIILMDINMPVMDGYEATQEIRKYSAKVPIIAVTAFAYASDEQRVMENGFDGYMPKPINARQLKAQITEIMQKRIILL